MKKTTLWLAAIVILVMALSACTRSASNGIPTESTFPTEVPAGVNNAVATQTAVVMAPQTGGGETKEEQQPLTQAPPPTPTARPTSKPTPKPTTKPATQPKPVATSVPAQYTIHKGEFPYCLARRFNINPDALLAANGLVRGQWVYPGTTLTIPQSAGPFPYQRALRPHPTTYVVHAGETLYSIACLFGDVWPEAIAAANGLSVNATLTPGQTLKIP